MKRASDYEKMMPLTEREVRILVALTKGRQMSGYEVARQVGEDSAERVTMSNGTLRPALERMSKFGLIEEKARMKAGPGIPARMWRVTGVGRMMLELELASYRRLTKLGEERL